MMNVGDTVHGLVSGTELISGTQVSLFLTMGVV